MTDVFRQTYTPLSDERKAAVQIVKEKAQELYDLLETQPQSREMSLAKTNLEQAIMWAVKSMTA